MLVDTLKGQGIEVEYANPTQDFQDGGLCEPNTDQVLFHDFVLGPNGDGDNPPAARDFINCRGVEGVIEGCMSREAFHPNGLGTSAYSQTVRRQLLATAKKS